MTNPAKATCIRPVETQIKLNTTHRSKRIVATCIKTVTVFRYQLHEDAQR